MRRNNFRPPSPGWLLLTFVVEREQHLSPHAIRITFPASPLPWRRCDVRVLRWPTQVPEFYRKGDPMNMPVSGVQARVDRARGVRATMKAPSVSVAAAVAGILFGAGAPAYAQQEAAEAPTSNDALSE